MISKLFILLLAVGFLVVILPKERYSRFVSVLLFAVGGLLLFNFYENWQLGGTHGLFIGCWNINSFIWILI